MLRRMARKTTPEGFAALVQSARAAIPEVAITTDIIVGFPGETDEEFTESLEFVKSMHFAGGHVFTYSRRPGTPAARMKEQVVGEVARARSVILRRTLAESAETYQQKFIGRRLPVLWEARSTLTAEGWQIKGLTDNFLRVTTIAPKPRWNQIDIVLLKTVRPDGLFGEILE